MEYFDVCILCALFEEANAFIEVLKKHGAQPEEKYSQQIQRNYYSASIQNSANEPLNLVVSWTPDMGGISTVSEFERLLQQFHPRFAAMTGICAGNKDKVKLGDLVIASSTYLFDSGSYVTNNANKSEHKYNTQTIQVKSDILHSVQMFEKWKEEAWQLTRPYSRHQQHDWLLDTLYKEKKSVYDIEISILDTYAPSWQKIAEELQQGKEPFLDENYALLQSERVRRLYYGSIKFPYTDPLEPAYSIGPIASGNAVRKDSPFEEITRPVSKAVALDMESYAFYATLQNHNSIRALLAKGVCDYADKEKDDSYHNYASMISAIYMYNFIKEFVTEERMPSPEAKKPKPAIVESKPAQPTTIPATLEKQGEKIVGTTNTEKSGETGKKLVKVFLSSSQSPDDEALIERLDKHLSFMRKHNKSIESWYGHNTRPGSERKAEAEEHLREAQIIILLLSPDYIYSDFYDHETPLIEERYNNKAALVIPILLRPLPQEWKETFYGKLQSLPRNNSAVSSWKDRDEAMKGIVDEIRTAVKLISERQ